MKDETLSHVPLFMHIFRTTVAENNIDLSPDTELVKFILNMITEMTNAEKRWTKYVSKGLLGFSERAIDVFVESKANSICKNLKLPLLYKEEVNNPLQAILQKHLKDGKLASRENYFENNVTQYNKLAAYDDL